MKRKGISKKSRFEIFKRDSFTCQYCGKSAPDVVLNVDHIIPVAGGGTDQLMNLVTSCFDCNAGKSDRLINDDAVIKKQMGQAKLLSEKREQLKMLAEWHQNLISHSDQEVAVFEKFILKNYDICLSDYGRSEFKKTIRKYGISDVLEATEKSSDSYLHDASDPEQRAKFLDYIVRICYWQKRERDNPVEGELRKIAYTANKLWWHCNPQSLSRRLIELNFTEKLQPTDLLRFVSASSGIMQFEQHVKDYFDSEVKDV